MDISVLHNAFIEELVGVWNRNLPVDPISPGRLETRVFLDPNFREDYCLVAREGECMIGFILGICGEGIHYPERPAGEKAWILSMAVETQHRGRGVGTALLEALESRFHGSGRREVWMASYPTAYIVPGVDERAYPQGVAFFRRHGYQVAYRALAMDASLWPPRFPEEAGTKEQQLATEGVTFHPYSSRWLTPFRAFLRSQVPWDWERLALRNLSRIGEGTFSPEMFVLAVSEGDVVGYCQHEGEHFGPFGVAQGFQGRGIGSVLLARGLRSMTQQGLHGAWVLWTGEEAARLYARFGFKVSRRFAVLHKQI
jgi:mycothiol synthase